MSQEIAAPTNAPPTARGAWGMFVSAYRLELRVFLIAFVVLAGFSGQRFWRQSEAPHFVYQAKAWLEGRSDIDAQVLPNYEDWACVREVGGVKQRCTGSIQPSDRWYSSFPWFPSVVMLPFVAVNGYQLNDTSFGVIVGALALAFFVALLRTVKAAEGTRCEPLEDALTALLMGFGTLFFYAAIRGEVWFSAEVMGVLFTALYARNSIEAKRPLLAGVFFSMAVLTRTPLLFTVVFFLFEALMPHRGHRLSQLLDFTPAKRRALLAFGAGAAPLALLAAAYNQVRFGSITEFGHRFFFNNRVNLDIDTYGLFSFHYLERNLDAAFLKLPVLRGMQLSYDPWGLSLFLTLPVLALCFAPAAKPTRALQLFGAMLSVLVVSALFPPVGQPLGNRSMAAWLVLALVLGFFVFCAVSWARAVEAPRLLVPTLVTVVACAAPGLLYQNTGYAQFGFRFSIDYAPYLFMLIPLAGWTWRKPLSLALALVGVMMGVAGAVGFKGFTEQMRGW